MKGKEIILNVSEAFQQDVGYGRARIDHQTRIELDLSIGDAIEIEGTKSTVAIVWRAHPTDEGKRLLRIDNLTRKNAGAGLGDRVKIRRAEIKEAKEISLAPLISKGQQIQFGSGIEVLIKKGLLRRPLTKGDNVIVQGIALFGSALPFAIINTNPSGIVSITENTLIKVKEEAAKEVEPEGPKASYEDIGGLHDEILKVREMIELPLKHPELFDRLGIDPPKGVLLHGPPGTGKTLIAKAVANESGASFYTINGPEIMSKFYGQSEENLRKIFEEAEKSAPSIIFIDEIDAIAPKRSEVQGEVERRVVSQMLTLMDGLKGRGKLIVIGATNIPDSIDPALRRPGRFDREIRIDAPDREGRKEILHIHTRGMPIRPPTYPTIIIDAWKERIEEIKIRKLEQDIDANQKAIEESKKEMAKFEAEEETLEEELKKLTNNDEELSKAGEELFKKGEELLKKEKNYDMERREHITHLNKLNDELNELKMMRITEDQGAINRFRALINRKSKQLEDFKDKINDITEKINTITDKVNNINEKINEINSKIEKVKSEKKEIEKLKKALEQQISETNNKMDKLKEEIEILKNKILERTSLEELYKFYNELEKNIGLLEYFYRGEKEIDHSFKVWGPNDPRTQIISQRKPYEELLSKIKDEKIRKKLREGFDPEVKSRIDTKSIAKLLDDVADTTYGYVGADLMALAREAAMNALRKRLPEIDLEKPIPVDVLEKMEVTMEDFKNAHRGIEPSAMREFFIEVPKVSWDDVGGLEVVKQHLQEAVEWPLTKPEVFKRMGIKPPRGILLYGAPGTGKTLLAKAVAHESKANFISIKGPEVMSKWVGESEKAVRELFKKARQVAPTIVFLDELDSIAPMRGTSTGSHVTDSVVNQLLTSIDGLESMEGVVVIGATNRPDIIDQGLLRPGRFDRLVLIEAPDRKARLEIFKIHTKGMPLAKDVNIKEMAKATENYSGADIEALCREAAMAAIRENDKTKTVAKAHFNKALNDVRASITPDIIKFYNKICETLGSGIAKKDKSDKDIQYM